MNTIFIIGQHRTGSTLLKNMLDAHSQIDMAFDEMNLFEPFRNNTLDKYLGKTKLTPAEFIEMLRKKKIYGTFWREFEKSGISNKELLNLLGRFELLDETKVLTAVLQLLKEKNNCKISGIKYPVHFRKVSYLLKDFPGSKIIFLTRNPKAIVASKINDPATKQRKGKSKLYGFLIHYFTLLYFCFEFNSSIKTYFQNKAHLYLVTYEDLVKNQQQTIQHICNFCGIEFEENMLKVSGKESSYNKNSSQALHNKSLQKYKEVLSPFDRKLIDFITLRNYKKILNEPHTHL